MLGMSIRGLVVVGLVWLAACSKASPTGTADPPASPARPADSAPPADPAPPPPAPVDAAPPPNVAPAPTPGIDASAATCHARYSHCSCAYVCTTSHSTTDCARACPREDLAARPRCGFVKGACAEIK